MKHFLILGNGRSGSTWLSTSFDQLVDVRSRREIKWHLPYQTPHPMHVYVNEMHSIKAAIENACSDPPEQNDGSKTVWGSKFIFDPYGYLHPRVFDTIARLLTREIRVMVLRRSYLDIFLSWKARGLFHRINQDVANRPGAVDRILVDAVLQLEEPPIKQIFLVHNSQRIDQKNYPLRQAIDDLLVLFYNDLKILELSRKVDLSLPIDYPDISTRFEELIRFVGSRASAAEAQRVLAAPAMSRLGSLGGNLVHPSGVLEAFAACLDAAFRQQAARCGSADEMWAWENDGESFVINVPGLRDLLATYSVLDSSLPAVANTRHWGAVRWAPLNPIYGASH